MALLLRSRRLLPITVVLRAVCSSGSSQNCWQSQILCTTPTCFRQTNLHYCSSTQVVGDEINSAENSIQGLHVPDRFPFRIIDNPGEETIILKREFDRESIEVLVHMPDMNRGNNDQCNDNGRNAGRPDIPFNATVVREDGPRMEFYCRLSSDDIKIDKVLLKGIGNSGDEDSYDGPDFQFVDKKVQRMFVEYLEMRGIQTSMANFLQDYMAKKYSKEYAFWSGKLKEILNSDPSLKCLNN